MHILLTTTFNSDYMHFGRATYEVNSIAFDRKTRDTSRCSLAKDCRTYSKTLFCSECRSCDHTLQTCKWTWDSPRLGTSTEPLRRFVFWKLRLDSWARLNRRHVRVRRLLDTLHNSFLNTTNRKFYHLQPWIFPGSLEWGTIFIFYWGQSNGRHRSTPWKETQSLW